MGRAAILAIVALASLLGNVGLLLHLIWHRLERRR